MFLDPIANALPRLRVGRIAWPLLTHPPKKQNREFPAEQERLVTADELLFWGFPKTG